MLAFQKITQADFPRLDAFYRDLVSREHAATICTGESRICDYAPGTLKMWHGAYDIEYAISGDHLFIRAAYGHGGAHTYLYPLGGDSEEALGLLRDHIRETGAGELSVIPEECVPQVMTVFRAENITEGTLHADRDWADYIYLKAEFENPTGKRHHRQKNLINRFVRDFPDYAFEAITEKNADEVLAFYRRYALENPATSDIDGMEFSAACDVLRGWAQYGMCGGILRLQAEGPICGFTFGEVWGDTVYVHVEKADKARPGAFQVLSRDFQRSIGGDAVYVNREEDMGLPGLRQSKTNYSPLRLDFKYSLEVRFAETPDLSRECAVF